MLSVMNNARIPQNVINEVNIFIDVYYLTDPNDMKIILIMKRTIGHKILCLMSSHPIPQKLINKIQIVHS